jgi:hypothetical protein
MAYRISALPDSTHHRICRTDPDLRRNPLRNFFLLYLRCGPAPYIAGVATLCAAWATAPIWGVRPQVLSFLLTSLWLLILERSDRNPKLLWWTLPLTLLWVNLHAGFALGLALSALFLAGALFEHYFGTPHPERALADPRIDSLSRSPARAPESQRPAPVFLPD